MNRYIVQMALPQIGEQGQKRLSEASVAVVGCGALGSRSAELLVRAGVGSVKLIDPDTVDETNLHRQTFYTEQDAQAQRAKVEVATERLRQINSGVTIEALVTKLEPANALTILNGVDVILDGTDNFETRYLINDVAVHATIPWVYGGVSATSAMILPVGPGRSACLRCLFPDPPEPGSLPTSRTSGLLNTVPALVAALQATAAIEIIVEGRSKGEGQLHLMDLWTWQWRQVPLARNPRCPTCGRSDFAFLEGRTGDARSEERSQ